MGRIFALSTGCLSTLVVIFACGTCAFLGLFLQTLFVLEREVIAAEVVMGPLQTDANGEYMEIQFTPYQYDTALSKILNQGPTAAPAPALGITQTYRVYGDTVAVRGPLIKLHTGLLLLNYGNIFKLTLIEGEYRRNSNAAARPEGTEIILNGGFDDSWWNFNDQEASYPYNLLIDRVTFSGDEEPGFTGGGHKRYHIVVTFDTITWNFIERIQP
jgi:hypothetical protein